MPTGLVDIGVWSGGAPAFAGRDLLGVVPRFREPAHVLRDPRADRLGVGIGGGIAALPNGAPAFPLLATLPALYPEWLGDRSFCEVHGVRFPYVSGAMANGIATTRLVIEMSRAGMLGFFGAAGLPLARVEAAVDEMARTLGPNAPWGSNLIHSPNEPAVEAAVADLYLRKRVRRVSAAAYMSLTPAVVRYACTGLRQGADGRIHRDNYLFAKISRPEVARHFLSPAPSELLQRLVQAGQLSAEEARLARLVPVAEDITVESDSGGHTDNQPLTALFPTIVDLRDVLAAEHAYTRPVRVGAAGGLGTPRAVAAAFALGAAYVLTGSVNQGCVESGLDASGKAMLAEADLADVVMAPAADMFELGVEVQVLKRGTMFGVRAKKLYELYRSHGSWDEVSASEQGSVEKQILQAPFAQAWASTRAFWAERDPREVERAERDPKHLMALTFRAYLGQSSKWAIAGLGERRMDFQIWCGPAMGSFNRWAKGSFLEDPAERRVAQVAKNLLEGAAHVTRAQQLRSYGVPVPASAFTFRPRPLS